MDVCILEWKAMKLNITVWIEKRNLFWPFHFMYRGSACLENVAEIYVAGCFQMLLNSQNRGEVCSKTSPSSMHKHTAWFAFTCTRYTTKTFPLLRKPNIRTVLDKCFPCILIIYDQGWLQHVIVSYKHIL